MLRKFSESYKNREIFSQRFQWFRRFRWFDLIWRFFQNKLWALKILNSTRKPNRSKLSQVANSLKRMNEVLSLGSDRNEYQLKGWKLENWNKVTKNGIYKWRSKIKDRKFTEISCVWVLLQSREPVHRRLTPDFAVPKKWIKRGKWTTKPRRWKSFVAVKIRVKQLLHRKSHSQVKIQRNFLRLGKSKCELWIQIDMKFLSTF